MSVYERGLVNVLHPHLMKPQEPAENMHVLYAAEEIASRMTKIRIRHMKCSDRVEAMLLQGEYKYFTGKKIHFENIRIDVLVAFLQCFSYFGFYSVPVLSSILHVAASSVHAMSPSQIDKILHYLWVLGKKNEVILSEIYDHLEAKVNKYSPEDLLGIFVSLERLACERIDLMMAISKRCLGKVELDEDALCSFTSFFAQHKNYGSQELYKALESSGISLFNKLTVLRQAKLLKDLMNLDIVTTRTHGPMILRWSERILDYFSINDESEVHEESEALDEYPPALALLLETHAKYKFFHPAAVVKAIDLLEDALTELNIDSAAKALYYLSSLYVAEEMIAITPLLHKTIEHILTLREQFAALPSVDAFHAILKALLDLPSSVLDRHQRIKNIIVEKTQLPENIGNSPIKLILQICRKHKWILSLEEQSLLLDRLVTSE